MAQGLLSSLASLISPPSQQQSVQISWGRKSQGWKEEATGKLPVECGLFYSEGWSASYRQERGALTLLFKKKNHLWSQNTKQEYFPVLVNRDSRFKR